MIYGTHISAYGNAYGDAGCTWWNLPCRARAWMLGPSGGPSGPDGITFAPSADLITHEVTPGEAGDIDRKNKRFPWWLVAVVVVGLGLGAVIGRSVAVKRRTRTNPRKPASQAPWWAAAIIGTGLVLIPEPITTVTGAGILATVAGAKLLT